MTNRKRIKTIQKTTPAAYGFTQESGTSSMPKARERKRRRKKQIIRFAFVFFAIANNERSVYEMQSIAKFT